MNPDHEQIIALLSNLTFLPGSFDKRFVRNVDKAEELSDKQIEWIFRLLYKYRKRLPSLYEKHKHNPFCQPLKKL